MIVIYKTNKLQKICTDASIAKKKYNSKMAAIIHQRIDEICAADTVEMMVQYKIGKCHLLKGERKNQYSMELIHPFRLVFEKVEDEVNIVRIMEIVDYH